jgi:uncharacterized protein YaiE (UPF0345 family)
MIKINEYFEGAVKSLEYQSKEGKSTIGVIESGEYEFGTSQHETMYVIEGSIKVLLPEQQEWQLFSAGQAFEVDSGLAFKVKTAQQASYLCKYK